MITDLARDYLEALADELAINDTRYEKAYASYEAVGDWLNREGSAIKKFDPIVYVQGSFAFGTVIKPYTNKEEYDVDAVCELRNLSKSNLTQHRLKELVGKELEAYRLKYGIDKPLDEGRRCWTLNYADEAQFHMDIVPSLSNGQSVKLLLEQRSLDSHWANTAIAITDNEIESYNVLTEDWPRSNPKGYRDWFKSRLEVQLAQRKLALATESHANVEDIPDYRVRTPLQSAIMILKRHRDVLFSEDKDHKSPISIIITTLAGHAYNGEEKVADALFSILSRMDSDEFIKRDGEKFVILNPSDPSENFADKWEEFPERKDAFFEWLNNARDEFEVIKVERNKSAITEKLSPKIGDELAKLVDKRTSGTSSLMRGSSAAAASSSQPAFGAQERRPTKPKGFA